MRDDWLYTCRYITYDRGDVIFCTAFAGVCLAVSFCLGFLLGRLL
jgi:hypothetical protein